MLLPYRAKNPPDYFPYVTVGLIVINVLIFALNSEAFLVANREFVEANALSHNTFSAWRLFASIFMHAHILHLAGNMLALWLFGASVEGRLRPAKYLFLYLMSGLAGSLLHEVMIGFAFPEQFSLGASGAIMGLTGAYLYLFPYSTICVFWMFYFRAGVMEWEARWVALMYVGLDIVGAFILPGGDGVGHFAHLGGFGMGLLLVFAFRGRRDSAAISQVQAARADLKDFSLLSLGELETLLEQPTEDMQMVMAYCEKAVTQYGGGRPEACLATMNRYARPLIEKIDAQRLATVLLRIPTGSGGMPQVFYLRLASQLERVSSNDLASQLYRRVYDLAPTTPDSEVALYRLGQLMQNVFHNHAYAQTTYMEQLRLFPNGQLSLQARQALQKLPVSR